MKRKEQSVLLAGLLAFGLAACTTERMGSTESATVAVPAGEAQAPSDAYGMPVTRGSTAVGASGTAGATGTASTQAQPATDPAAQGMDQTPADTRTAAAAPNSVVTLIEVVPRQAGAASAAAGTMAGAAVGGTGAAGTTATSDRVYRITLQMDDGTTRVVTQEWAPTFRSGDRVNLTGGEIQRR